MKDNKINDLKQKYGIPENIQIIENTSNKDDLYFPEKNSGVL